MGSVYFGTQMGTVVSGVWGWGLGGRQERKGVRGMSHEGMLHTKRSVKPLSDTFVACAGSNGSHWTISPKDDEEASLNWFAQYWRYRRCSERRGGRNKSTNDHRTSLWMVNMGGRKEMAE